MRLKAEWFAYLHELRAAETSLIFDRFPQDCFGRALELGAGDGFQSRRIRAHAMRVVSTDCRRPPLDEDDTLEVRQLPAERVAEAFPPGQFDLVFSSNMLEHVPDPGAVLEAVHVVLADDGITIHVMPNQIWKICQLVLYVPNLVVTAVDDLVASRSGRVLLDRLRKGGDADCGGEASEKNNPTVVRAKRSMIQKLLLPRPHGVSATHGQELKAFSRSRWETELTGAGFELVALLNGPFSSGYGFGVDAVRRVLEKRGVGSEYVYVAKKTGKTSRFEPAFDEVVPV